MAKPAESMVRQDKPGYVSELEAVFGPPSQAGFGSAVFFDLVPQSDDLAEAALAYYQFFVGEAWAKLGAEAWMGPWQEVYARPIGGERNIVTELGAITDRSAKISTSVFLEGVSDPAGAKSALAVAFDEATVSKLAIYNVGDDAALSGILIAGQRGSLGETTFVTFLLD